MEHYNGLPTPTKVEAPLGTDANGSEAKRDWTNSYDSVIGMVLYLASHTRPDIYFAVHRYDRFTHNTKASHETSVKSIFRYLRGTKEKAQETHTDRKSVVRPLSLEPCRCLHILFTAVLCDALVLCVNRAHW